MTRLTNREVDLRASSNISCSARGPSYPTISWMIDDKVLQKNDKIFTVNEMNDKETVTSTITIKNIISFDKDVTIYCSAGTLENRKQIDFVINSGKVTTDYISNKKQQLLVI